MTWQAAEWATLVQKAEWIVTVLSSRLVVPLLLSQLLELAQLMLLPYEATLHSLQQHRWTSLPLLRAAVVALL